MSNNAVSMTDLMRGVGMSDTPRFIQHNLISDRPMMAEKTDPNLVNPWGVSFSPSSPFWISENGTGVASVDSLNNGNAIMLNAHAPVTIPSPSGDTSAPTGTVFNSNSDAFKLSDGQSANFMFATEDGTIAGWNGGLGNTAETKVNNSPDAVYKGLAIGSSDRGPTIYAANFRGGTVDMFDQNFQPIRSFTDPTVPTGFAPFDVKVIDNKLYVTFALQDDMKHDDVAGAGNGFVDVFDLNGKNPPVRIGSKGDLNSPWGLAIAPASFGNLAGDLLVGNFGDGKINVFNQNTDQFLGQLAGPNGNTIAIDGLWSLTTGNGGSAGDPNTIFFTAGPNGEQDGLFGSLSAIPNIHSA